MDPMRDRVAILRQCNFASAYTDLPGNLYVWQNLTIFGRIYGVKNLQQRIDELLEMFEITHLKKRVTGHLSAGESTRLQLCKALLNRPDLVVTTLTEKLMTYGVGRGIGYADMPTVRTIVRDAASNQYRFSSLVLGIVNSKPFQMRMKAQESTQGTPGDQGKRASR